MCLSLLKEVGGGALPIGGLGVDVLSAVLPPYVLATFTDCF
jgi:hypothetical protein